jgi:hypothetical protein
MALIVGGTTVTGTQTLDATRLTGNLPAISGASLTGISAGITVAGQFRITSNQTGDQDPLNAWEENDTNYTRIGSAVTQSSGIFTFPSTGIYLILWDIACNSTGGTDKSAGWEIFMTTDNSSYSKIARNTESFSDTYQYKNTNTSAMVDITNVSNDKIKFVVTGTNNVVQTDGNTGENQTAVTFLRLGDT